MLIIAKLIDIQAQVGFVINNISQTCPPDIQIVKFKIGLICYRAERLKIVLEYSNRIHDLDRKRKNRKIQKERKLKKKKKCRVLSI